MLLGASRAQGLLLQPWLRWLRLQLGLWLLEWLCVELRLCGWLRIELWRRRSCGHAGCSFDPGPGRPGSSGPADAEVG
jgi:hypothetical protein